jgi:hypothetical protein
MENGFLSSEKGMEAFDRRLTSVSFSAGAVETEPSRVMRATTSFLNMLEVRH